MLSEKKRTKIIYDIYREAYKKATPSADFDELVKKSPRTKEGVKKIPFNDYSIEESVLDDIIERNIKNNKLNKLEGRGIKTSIYLGCSPKFA